MDNQKIEIAAVWPTQDREQVKRLLAELMPLFEAYWLEARQHPSLRFEFKVEDFVVLWQMRKLVLIVARVDGQTVGFTLISMMDHVFAPLNTACVLYAYVDPAYRTLSMARQGAQYLKQLAPAMNLDLLVRIPEKALDVIYQKERFYA